MLQKNNKTKVQMNLESSFAAIETKMKKRDDVTNESTSFNEEGGPRVDLASTDRK